jgi:hypothetical protein
MKVGFTGTREGLTPAQRDSFEQHFIRLGATHFHHGACVGADAEVAVWVATARMPQPASSAVRPLRVWCVIHAHPSNTPGMTEPQAVNLADYVYLPMRPLDRNRNIVDETETLIACPKGEEEIRSGTWYTVRYARRLKRKVVICWPDGQVTEEN